MYIVAPFLLTASEFLSKAKQARNKLEDYGHTESQKLSIQSL